MWITTTGYLLYYIELIYSYCVYVSLFGKNKNLTSVVNSMACLTSF